MEKLRRTIIAEFTYDSEEEKLRHKKEMEKLEYSDSCQIKINLGTINNPDYRWYGKYFKYE